MTTTTKPSSSERIYQDVTNRILERLMEGDIPWRQTWTPDSKNGNSPYRNPFSNSTFSFLNQILLGKPGLYATFNQIKSRNGSIRKGAKSKKVVFWTMYIPKKDKEEAKRLEEAGKSTEHLKLPVLKEYALFNLEDDTEGLDIEHLKGETHVQTEETQNPDDIIRMVLNDYKVNEAVTINEDGTAQPLYDPYEDTVTVPPVRCFGIKEDYWATLMTQLVHSTATEERGNRKIELEKMLKGEMSVKEELTAEIGSSMVLSACGLTRDETHEQTAAVCQMWMDKIRKDYRVLIHAAGAAEKAAKYVLGNFA